MSCGYSVRLPLALSLSHLSQEMLASLEVKQSESLSELITLRENLESSRLEGELLRQEQTEVTAALARVRRPPPHLILHPASQILYLFCLNH